MLGVLCCEYWTILSIFEVWYCEYWEQKSILVVLEVPPVPSVLLLRLPSDNVQAAWTSTLITHKTFPEKRKPSIIAIYTTNTSRPGKPERIPGWPLLKPCLNVLFVPILPISSQATKYLSKTPYTHLKVTPLDGNSQNQGKGDIGYSAYCFSALPSRHAWSNAWTTFSGSGVPDRAAAKKIPGYPVGIPAYPPRVYPFAESGNT